MRQKKKQNWKTEVGCDVISRTPEFGGRAIESFLHVQK